MKQDTLTRKEIGHMIKFSAETVRRKERHLGLDTCRTAHKRPIQYWAEKALHCLKQRNYVQ